MDEALRRCEEHLAPDPAHPPLAKSCVLTVTATVANMTTLELTGWLRNSRNERQWNVPMDTMIITARKLGRLSGNCPMSPTVWTCSPKLIDTAVSTTIATRGDGTARVTMGSR